MSLVRKLKPDRSITGVIIPFSIVPIFGLATLIFGLSVGLITLGIWMWVYSLFYLYVFIRTRNIAQLVICVEGIFFGFMFLVFEPDFGTNSVGSLEFRAAYISGVIFFGLILISLVLTRRLKWRGREIFELAGESVDEAGNGYTSRPRPVGKVEYSLQQMQAFSHFCARHLIALPYITSKNITLVPIKMGEEFGRLLGLSGDYRDATWVNFDVNGEVSVHIAQKDYLDYREPLAFDQLCTSFGQVFIDFIELYKKGEGVRVIDRMDDLKLSVLS
ncbi:MAG: hypothetical protein A2Z71_01470 [Chloroflexi bacterium RBG_13_50_21]|nr:MAG: hypothetical protein A2Z71_01470 [Chloroflexi bacterium RBG_13_50_21]OGO62375.1 MAG: hypothetical protein A2029_02100 [Chloroflexi bacterium RBG_19FT_COMBO_47_9]